MHTYILRSCFFFLCFMNCGSPPDSVKTFRRVAGSCGSLHLPLLIGIGLELQQQKKSRWSGGRVDMQHVLTANGQCSPCEMYARKQVSVEAFPLLRNLQGRRSICRDFAKSTLTKNQNAQQIQMLQSTKINISFIL